MLTLSSKEGSQMADIRRQVEVLAKEELHESPDAFAILRQFRNPQ